jgi:hypothetical protein
MARHERKTDIATDALDRLLIRGAKTAGPNADNDLPGAGLRRGKIFQHKLIVVFENGRQHNLGG